MSYTPNPTWVDFPSTTTPITAAKLNNMEAAIAASLSGAERTIAADGPAYGAIADFSTDNAPLIQAALNAQGTSVVTLQGGNAAAYGLKSPIIVPNATRLRMSGSHGTGSQLKALSTFPHTTVNGAQTTPASSATTFTLTVAATAGFPLGVGGLTLSGGGTTGVLTVYGCTIFYTGTTGTTFTGCQTFDTNVTIPNSAYLSTPMVWLGYPGLTTGQDFGSRIECASIHCNSIAGAGLYSSHVQECGGWYDVHVLAAMNFGIRVDAIPQVSGYTPVNWEARKMNIEVDPTADSQAVGLDVFNLKSPMWDGRISISDVSIVSGGGVTVVGLAAMRLNGFGGRVTDVHMERYHDGILVGDKAACNATIENVSAGSTGFGGAGKAFVHIANTSGQVVHVRQVYKALTGDSRILLQDDMNSFTQSTSETDLAYYMIHADGSRETSSPSYTGVQYRDTRPAFTASGLTGATSASRYVGATTSGAPASGSFLNGDFVIDQTGAVWVCTTAGSPGTWATVGGGGGGGALTNSQNYVSTDVSLTASIFADGPTLTLAAGTWLLTGQVELLGSTTAIRIFSGRLWDGTTIISQVTHNTEGTGQAAQIGLALSAIVTPSSSTTYKISAQSNVTGDKILGTGRKGSYLLAVKIA